VHIEREVAIGCRCLEWRQAVSGCLMSAATFEPAVPDCGCFLRCSTSDALEASSTRSQIVVEGWRSIATDDAMKISSRANPVNATCDHDLRSSSIGFGRTPFADARFDERPGPARLFKSPHGPANERRGGDGSLHRVAASDHRRCRAETRADVRRTRGYQGLSKRTGLRLREDGPR